VARTITSPARTRVRRTGRLLATSVAVLAVAVAGACTSASEPIESPPASTVMPTIDAARVTPPEPVVPIVWPLTGVATAEVANRPAIAVKIENTKVARPQAGLEAADVVWETIVEFDVSRLVAVFHSQMPEEIGPIRSVRPMDPLIASPLKGLIVFSGGQQGILNLVYSSSLQPISHDAGADGLYRVSRRSAPHNVYGSLADFLAQADANHSAPPGQQFVFAPRPGLASAVRLGGPASSLSFYLSSLSSPSWTWDAATGTWLRSEGGTAATAESGARLSAVNVVSITAPHPPTGFGAQGGAAVPTYELIGDGDCVVATGGMVVSGRWHKGSQDEPMMLIGADGQQLMLAPGNTWVELVPAGQGTLTLG
jgi:hypothetical protein